MFLIASLRQLLHIFNFYIQVTEHLHIFINHENKKYSRHTIPVFDITHKDMLASIFNSSYVICKYIRRRMYLCIPIKSH